MGSKKIERILEIWDSLDQWLGWIKNFLNDLARQGCLTKILIAMGGGILGVVLVFVVIKDIFDKGIMVGSMPHSVQVAKKENGDKGKDDAASPRVDKKRPPADELESLLLPSDGLVDEDPPQQLKEESSVPSKLQFVAKAGAANAPLSLPSLWPVGTKFRDCDECPELVVVPAGSFLMGSPVTEKGRYRDEEPVHQVTFDQRFAVGKYEVTRGEYMQFVFDTEHSTTSSCTIYEEGEWKERSGHSWRNPGYPQTERDPVVCVSWKDAQAYVKWLSKKTGKAYRLLSEAEWEYVARAGTTTPFSTGVTISTEQANYHSSRTVPVGSFKPNAFGLHDLHGNVWEWVADCWNGSYAGAPTDGRAWESGECRLRVVRGGSWNEPNALRSADRFGLASDVRYSIDGFRVARSLTTDASRQGTRGEEREK